MATQSSILAWRTLWTKELGGLQSMGLQRVGYHLATKQQQAKARETLDFCFPDPYLSSGVNHQILLF